MSAEGLGQEARRAVTDAPLTRRGLLLSAMAAAAAPLASALAAPPPEPAQPSSPKQAIPAPEAKPTPPAAAPLFPISLAQWSLHRTLRSGALAALDFPVAARRDFGLDAVEYVNSFFLDKVGDEAWLRQLDVRCRDHGVRSVLIMCDGLGRLGDPDEAARRRAIEAHRPWIDAARLLGCHAIRVNAASSGSWQEQRDLAAEGLRRLAEQAEAQEISVIVENHGGLSSNGRWLAETIKAVGHPRCGTLPDFGNFDLGDGTRYDCYVGVAELMPYARGVSAKSHDFDERGEETRIDYRRMLRIVLDAGYRGHVGIEYEGSRLDEAAGIRATKALLERVRAELAPEYA